MQVEQIEIPEQWCEALRQVQEVDRNAIIAGGALRDLCTGHEVKDVDVFTTAQPIWDIPNPESSDKDYEGMQYVQAIISYDAQPYPFNVIIIKPTDWVDLLRSFDFGICQIGFDGKQLLKTQEFLWDVKNTLFTMRHIDRYPRSILRYARISQRYQAWPIAIPQLDELNWPIIKDEANDLNGKSPV